MSVFLTSMLTRQIAVVRSGSHDRHANPLIRKQDATKVGNKPPPMERKNNDLRGREIIGARSLRVSQRQGQRDRCPARSKDLHLHPAPGVRSDILGADGTEGGRRLLFIVPSAERNRERRRNRSDD